MSVFETVDVAVKRPRLFSVDYTIAYAPGSNVKNTNFHVVKVTAASGLPAIPGAATTRTIRDLSNDPTFRSLRLASIL
jgi:hypothetical protein